MNAISEELWLPVVGWEGIYEVSNHGQVRSLDREVTRTNRRTGHVGTMRKRGQIMKPRYVTARRYPTVRLSRPGEDHVAYVHVLVLTAFVGPRPEGMHGCHWDDDATNNHVSNLRWDTPTGNARDKLRNGNNHFASRTHCDRGHEYTDSNTQLYNGNYRRCLTCRREYDRLRYLERRSSA